MTIASEIVRIQTAIANAYTACQDMGATMPLVQDSDHLEACIDSISVGPVSQHWYNWSNYAGLEIKQTLTVPFTGNYRLCYANGVYLAWLENSSTYYTSTDLENWTSRTTPDSFTGSFLSSNNVFMLYKQQKPTPYFSSDGGNWVTQGTLPYSTSSTPYYSVANNKFFALYNSNGSAIYSTDGTSSWSSANWPVSGVNPYTLKVVYANGIYFISLNSNQKSLVYSTDAVNWDSLYISSGSVSSLGLIYRNNWLIPSYSGRGIFYSSTGVSNWSSLSVLPSTMTQSGTKYLLQTSNTILAQRDTDANAAYSTDNGSSWTSVTLPAASAVNTCGDLFYIATSDTLYYSSDGHNWSSISLPSGDTWYTGTTVVENKLYQACTTSGKMLEISNPNVYTLDQNPTTSSVVYSAPATQSALTITSVGTGTITLSDTYTYTYNSSGDIEQ